MGILDSWYQPGWMGQPNQPNMGFNWAPGMSAGAGPLGSSLASQMPAMNFGGPNFASNIPVPKAGMTPDQLRFRLGQLEAQPDPTLGNINAITQGAGVLGNLGLGIWGMVNATDAYNFQKKMAQGNYDNSVKSYNTAQEDRVRGMYSASQYEQNKTAIDAEAARRKI